MHHWRLDPKFRKWLQLKICIMAKSTMIWKCTTNENSVRNKTVGTIAKQRLELKNQVFTTFVTSWLVMVRLLTLTRLPRACSYSKPHDYKKYEKWRNIQKHGFHLRTNWRNQTKNTPTLANQPKGTQRPSKSQTIKGHSNQDEKQDTFGKHLE